MTDRWMVRVQKTLTFSQTSIILTTFGPVHLSETLRVVLEFSIWLCNCSKLQLFMFCNLHEFEECEINNEFIFCPKSSCGHVTLKLQN